MQQSTRPWNAPAWMLAAFIAGTVFTYSGGGGGDGGSSAVAAPSDAQFAALMERVAELETLLAAVSLNPAGDLEISGVNVRIRSGSGSTAGAPNGKGNLIVGYDEDDGGDFKTGSHNLVIGPSHSYSNYGGLVAGQNNIIAGPSASVTGGEGNTASGFYASVSGGYGNTAIGYYASVSGGYGNTASGYFASVSGGDGNTASGNNASVSGGVGNTASGSYASVSGGQGNTASGIVASVSGGEGCNSGAVTYFWGVGDQAITADCQIFNKAP